MAQLVARRPAPKLEVGSGTTDQLSSAPQSTTAASPAPLRIHCWLPTGAESRALLRPSCPSQPQLRRSILVTFPAVIHPTSLNHLEYIV